MFQGLIKASEIFRAQVEFNVTISLVLVFKDRGALESFLFLVSFRFKTNFLVIFGDFHLSSKSGLAKHRLGGTDRLNVFEEDGGRITIGTNPAYPVTPLSHYEKFEFERGQLNHV